MGGQALPRPVEERAGVLGGSGLPAPAVLTPLRAWPGLGDSHGVSGSPAGPVTGVYVCTRLPPCPACAAVRLRCRLGPPFPTGRGSCHRLPPTPCCPPLLTSLPASCTRCPPGIGLPSPWC